YTDTQIHRYTDIQDIQDAHRYRGIYMLSTTTNKTTVLTHEDVFAWRCELFDGRSLRVPVEELHQWPLSRYLWAAVVQTGYLDGLREEKKRSWQTPAWDFGRFAKAHPLLID